MMYALQCTECGAGCDRCNLSVLMRYQPYRIGAPSDNAVFGGDGYEYSTQLVALVTDIIFQAQREDGSPMDSLQFNTFFEADVKNFHMRRYIEEIVCQAVSNIPEYVLRSLGDSTSGAINALRYMLDRPDYGDGRLFLIFHPGVHHGEPEEREYSLRLERILVAGHVMVLG